MVQTSYKPQKYDADSTVVSVDGLCGYYLTFANSRHRMPNLKGEYDNILIKCFDIRLHGEWHKFTEPFTKGLPCIECVANASEELHEYLQNKLTKESIR